MTTAPRFSSFGAFDAEALKTQSRADYVYERLRLAISEGRFKRGERIREEDIAATLGVSRTPVREALRRLQQRGLLINTVRGLAVAELNMKQLFELYAVRTILEGCAARFAAQHANAAELDLLFELQKKMVSAPNNAQVLGRLNRQFHQVIYDAAHNQYLSQTLEHLLDSMALLHYSTFRSPPGRAESDAEHLRIIEAIKRRDADLAELESRRHIERAQNSRVMEMK
jgi:DNA-binding GntR family transcriptional regulator